MPNGPVHEFVAKAILGKEYSEVNKILDWPSRYEGSAHRKHFHTLPEAALLGAIASLSFAGAVAGMLHVLVDSICSDNREIAQSLNKMATKSKKKSN